MKKIEEKCHCGKNGHALGSINCSVHGYTIKELSIKKERFNKVSKVTFGDGEIYGGYCDNPVSRGDYIRIGYKKKGDADFWQMNLREAISFQKVLAEAIWKYFFVKKKL